MRGSNDSKNYDKFNLVPPKHFAYNPRGSRKLGLGFNDTEKTYIITFNDNVFRIKDSAQNIVLDIYLFMYLSRKEWDRRAEYISWGSSTEVFDWNIFCDEEIELPNLSIQRKYVDIYKAMVANQQSYERGLEDLKLTFDALIDKVKHTAPKRPTRKLLIEVDERNEDGAVTSVQGINISKQFMPSIADITGVNLKKYKLVHKGQFAFSGMQTGRDECIRIALYNEDKSNFRIAIVVDMWITGFDVPSLTYLYNDKPLKRHLLIQTISRVNRKYPGKDYGFIIDYIGIRDNMREALKIYGGDHSIAPTADDVQQATDVFREELSILKDLFSGYDLTPFLNPAGDPALRYRLLAKAAEYVFVSAQELQTEIKGGKDVRKVSFKTYFLKTVKRMRAAHDICQPSGELDEEESALAQCFMAIAGFVRKMNGTDTEVDTDTMNRHVAKMVEEALKYNEVESVLEDGEQEDIFSPEYYEKLSDVKMPASKLELLVKMLRKQIMEYGKTNQMAAKKYQEMLEETIKQYHERRKHLTAEEAGEAQEQTSEEIIRNATEQALRILREMNADRESFRKIGLTFEEKAFYDILMALRDEYNFEYGKDKIVDGISVNEKCSSLARKIKEIIDAKSSFADWLNNQNVRDQLKFDIKVCLIKNGYPPQYSPEVFRKVMEQVENIEEHSSISGSGM